LLKPGSLWVYPAKHPHYAWTGTDGGVLQVQYIGPGGIDYINPEDDPQKKGCPRPIPSLALSAPNFPVTRIGAGIPS
jgi:hypothetical protein